MLILNYVNSSKIYPSYKLSPLWVRAGEDISERDKNYFQIHKGKRESKEGRKSRKEGRQFEILKKHWEVGKGKGTLKKSKCQPKSSLHFNIRQCGVS